MALIQDQPEDLPSSNDLDGVEDPDTEPSGERAEIYLSGAHVCTLDDAPDNRQRITLMVEVEIFEESVRANGDEDVPIRKARRVGDMYLPGTQRPPTKDELAAITAAAKAKAAAEQAARDEAERAEAETNEPPMFDEDGNAIGDDAPAPPAADEDQDQDVDGPALAVVGPTFSDVSK